MFRTNPAMILASLALAAVFGLHGLTSAFSQNAANNQAEKPSTESQVPTIGGFPPALQLIETRKPKSKEQIESFVDKLTSNDAMFEIVLGESRLLPLKVNIAEGGNKIPTVAVGDESILEFDILPDPKVLRLVGLRPGVTDLTITTASGESYAFQVHVVYDLNFLRARLKELFPDATLKIGQLRDHVVVEGEAKSGMQANRIVEVIRAYVVSLQVEHQRRGGRGDDPPPDPGDAVDPNAAPGANPPNNDPDQPAAAPQVPVAGPETVSRTGYKVKYPEAQVINLIRIPDELELLRLRLKQSFPDSNVTLRQFQQHVIVEGEVSSNERAARVLEIVRVYFQTIYASRAPMPSGLETVAPEVINLLYVPAEKQLELLNVRLREMYPDVTVEVGTLRDHIVVKGEARDPRQKQAIIGAVDAYFNDAFARESGIGIGTPVSTSGTNQASGSTYGSTGLPQPTAGTSSQRSRASQFRRQIIDLLTIPGPQQVMLKVQVAELNRTAIRSMGVDFLYNNDGVIAGTQLAGAAAVGSFQDGTVSTAMSNPLAALQATIVSGPASGLTAFGVVDAIHAQFFLNALRRNTLLKILAEPTLVAMNGHEASFLAGGEFPVPVPQGLGTVSIEYKPFGVNLQFVPQIQRDETIRLSVSQSVSQLDALTGITVLGTTVPGLLQRRAQTTVELKEGQTLLMAGLVQLQTSASNSQIPFVERIPLIGSLHQASSEEVLEKELVILVTPFLVEARESDDSLPLPGDDVDQPTDLELFLYHRIEGCTGTKVRSTTFRNVPKCCYEVIDLEQRYVRGPHGYTDIGSN